MKSFTICGIILLVMVHVGVFDSGDKIVKKVGGALESLSSMEEVRFRQFNNRRLYGS